MYYLILLCVAALLHTSAALNGCNETCSSILDVKGSGNFNDDCNAGVTAEFFKCISAQSSCDDVAKARIAEQSISKYYQGLTGEERGSCGLSCSCGWFWCGCSFSCSWKRDANETIPTTPLFACSEAGLCLCNNKCKALLHVSTIFILFSCLFKSPLKEQSLSCH